MGRTWTRKAAPVVGYSCFILNPNQDPCDLGDLRGGTYKIKAEIINEISPRPPNTALLGNLSSWEL